LTFGLLAAGYAVWRGKLWALGLTGVLATVSLIVCVAGLPETAAGVAIDVLILATVSYVWRNSHATTRAVAAGSAPPVARALIDEGPRG
jgi:hypothetical protein